MNSDKATVPEKASVPEFLLSQMNWYLETYRHHYRTFVTCTAIYLVAVATICSYIFGEKVPVAAKLSLCGFLAVASVIFSFGCHFIAYRWAKLVQARIDEICRQLGIAPFPLVGPATARVVMIVGSVFLVGSLTYAATIICTLI